MRQANFIENPSHRTKADRPIMSMTTGHRWDSVFIEVSAETYFTVRFRDWVDNHVFPRIMPGGSIRIAIITAEEAPHVDN